MKSPQQAVLAYLGEWVTGRFISTYNASDFDRLVRRTLKVAEDYDPDSVTEEIQRDVREYFDAENLAKEVSRSISEGFSGLEQLATREGVLGIDVSGVPQEIEEEIARCIKSYNRIKKLVDLLREKFEEKFPDSLSIADIESTAKFTFTKQEELADSFDDMRRANLLSIYFRGVMEQESPEELIMLRKSHNAGKYVFRNIYRRMFADLYESGEGE